MRGPSFGTLHVTRRHARFHGRANPDQEEAAMTLPVRTARDGLELPTIGFGTHRVQGPDGLAAIGHALENGYRLCPWPFWRDRA